MKKLLVLLLATLLVLGMSAVIGCGDSGEKDAIEVEEKNGDLEVKTEEGTAKTGTVSEEDLGVPVYPGAVMDKEASGSVSTESSEGEASYSSAVLYTDDSVEEVTAWYKEKLAGQPNFTDLSTTVEGQQSGLFMFSSGDAMKMVTVSPSEDDDMGETMIVIGAASGADMNPTQ